MKNISRKTKEKQIVEITTEKDTNEEIKLLNPATIDSTGNKNTRKHQAFEFIMSALNFAADADKPLILKPLFSQRLFIKMTNAQLVLGVKDN